ncbi:MAG: hypothetical protein OEU32_04305 [Acidimicrobiia bacterium]|nr:hypothetical protein [Acidimicrobiia bacterium]
MSFATAISLLALVLVPTAASARPDGGPKASSGLDGKTKVELCHVNGEGVAKLVSIAPTAVDAHEGHGDGVPGGAVAGMDGYEFDETCTLVQADPGGVPAGCYDNNSGVFDLMFSGEASVVGNVVFVGSTDGTCSGEPGMVRTLVEADDAAGAGDICIALGSAVPSVINLNGAGFDGFAVTAWVCGGSPV